jgi:hypothetical protein
MIGRQVWWLVVLLWLATPLMAQRAVSGVVRDSASGAPLPYAIVRGDDGTDRLTDYQGRFRITAAREFVVRRIGYAPRTIAVPSGATDPTTIDVALAALSLQLRTVDVRDNLPPELRRCRTPGVPDRTQYPRLAAVLDQVRDNATQYTLAADAYPVDVLADRRLLYRNASEFRIEQHDSTLYRLAARPLYKPGQVVRAVPRVASDYELFLPSLPDFADSAFLERHCWWEGGVDSWPTGDVVRIDFGLSDRLRDPDVAGSVWLDADSYLIRSYELVLVRQPRALKGTREVRVVSCFRDAARGLRVLDAVRSRTTYERSAGREKWNAFDEERRLVRLDFLAAMPEDAVELVGAPPPTCGNMPGWVR